MNRRIYYRFNYRLLKYFVVIYVLTIFYELSFHTGQYPSFSYSFTNIHSTPSISQSFTKNNSTPNISQSFTKNNSTPNTSYLTDMNSTPNNSGRTFKVYCPNLYNGESQLLTLKLSLLNDYVDYFIIATSNLSHSRRYNPPPSYSPMENEISKYSHKITYFQLSYPPNAFSSSWHSLSGQYNDLMKLIDKYFHPGPDDLFIESDTDEIIYPSTMKYILQNPPQTFYKLHCDVFYYSLRWMKKEKWNVVAVFRYGYSSHDLYHYRAKQITANTLPNHTCLHCSSCFQSIQKFQFKINQAAHTNFARQPYNETEYLAAQIKCGNDVYTGKQLELTDFQLFTMPNPKLQFLIQPFPFKDEEMKNPDILNETKFNSYYNQCKNGISLIPPKPQ